MCHFGNLLNTRRHVLLATLIPRWNHSIDLPSKRAMSKIALILRGRPRGCALGIPSAARSNGVLWKTTKVRSAGFWNGTGISRWRCVFFPHLRVTSSRIQVEAQIGKQLWFLLELVDSAWQHTRVCLNIFNTIYDKTQKSLKARRYTTYTLNRFTSAECGA